MCADVWSNNNLLLASSFIFYRLDVPGSYLASLKNERPTGQLVVFRWGGDHVKEGYDVGKSGKERKEVLLLLSSISAACGEIAKAIAKDLIPAITQDRLGFLYPQVKKQKVDDE